MLCLPKFKQTLLLILIVISIFFVSGCSSRSGDYGPFTLVIESEDGKKVEDIIVTLSFITQGFMGKKTDTYNNSQVVSSGEVITFPRGYVTRTEDNRFSMSLSISHLDYQRSGSAYVSIDKIQSNQEIINLGKTMIRFNEISEEQIIERVKQGKMIKNQGRVTVETITKDEAVRSIKRSRVYMKAPSYFVKAIKVGRKDLADKHILLALINIYGDEFNSVEAQLFERELRESIDYSMEGSQ